MRLVFTSDLSGLGGGEVGILYLIEELKAQKHECILICRCNGRLVQKAREQGIEVIVYDYKNKIHLVSTFNYLSKLLSGIKPNAIISNDPTTAVLMGVSYRHGINTWICHGQWYQFGSFKKILLSKFVRVIFCVSDAVRLNLTRQGFDNCVTTFLGVPLSLFEQASGIGLEEEFSISKKSIVIATIARFQPIKGQMNGVRAIEIVLEAGYNVTYMLVGGTVFDSVKDKEYEQKVKQYVMDSGLSDNVIFAGERDDVGSILKSVDYLLIPSENESLGLIALEAIAANTSVLSTPNDGLSEIFNSNPLFIAKSSSPEDLAKLIVFHLCNNNSEAVSSELRKLKHKYSIEFVAQIFVATLLKCENDDDK